MDLALMSSARRNDLVGHRALSAENVNRHKISAVATALTSDFRETLVGSLLVVVVVVSPNCLGCINAEVHDLDSSTH
jgi:hypothetical protein